MAMESKAREPGCMADGAARERAEKLAGPFEKAELDAALLIAAQIDDGQVARLLALGASPAAAIDGEHALGVAAEAGAAAAVAGLLAAGADARQKNARGMSPFARAAIRESEACMRLLEPSSDVDMTFKLGLGADRIELAALAHALIFGGNRSCLAFLLEVSDLGGKTWIHGRDWTINQLALEWAVLNEAEEMLEAERRRRQVLAEAREIAAASREGSGRGRARSI